MTQATTPDMTRIRPYGDTLDDGLIQLSFTLPVPVGPEAYEAALQMMRQMNLKDPKIARMENLTTGFTLFVAYGSCQATVDYTNIRVPKVEHPVLDFDEINALIEREIGRPLVILGACTGTDAHTVGIDAIINMKGYAGHYGLERYPMVRAFNLGAQVPNDVLVARAIAESADAILVSQVVTQKNVHLHNLTQLIDLLEAEGLRQRLIAVVGGPRLTHELATEMGFDAGFGPGQFAEDVASFVVQEMIRRRGEGNQPQMDTDTSGP